MTGQHDAAAAPKRPRLFGHPYAIRVTVAVCVWLVMLGLVEVVLRAMTRRGIDGMPVVAVGQDIPLLPYRPDAKHVEAWFSRAKPGSYLVNDPELGWTIGKNRTNWSGLYRSNAQGIRTADDRVYDPAPPGDRRRVCVFGDSFTHGDEVAAEDTWPYQLERECPGLEVLNFGVPGYGTDQAFLRWRRDGKRFRSHVTILGIWPEDICRNLNTNRYYMALAGGFRPKPRFVLEDGHLRLTHCPVPEASQVVQRLSMPATSTLMADEFWISHDELAYKPLYRLHTVRVAASVYNMYRRKQRRHRLYSGQDRRAIDLTVAIADQFRAEVQETGALPLILLLPMDVLLKTYPIQGAMPLVTALRDRGHTVIDLGPVFARSASRDGLEHYFLLDGQGHLNATGNRLVASEICARLGSELSVGSNPN